MGKAAKSSMAKSRKANTSSFDGSREPSSTAVKMAAFSEMVPLKLWLLNSHGLALPSDQSSRLPVGSGTHRPMPELT